MSLNLKNLIFWMKDLGVLVVWVQIASRLQFRRENLQTYRCDIRVWDVLNYTRIAFNVVDSVQFKSTTVDHICRKCKKTEKRVIAITAIRF